MHFVTMHNPGAVPSPQGIAANNSGLCGDCVHARTIKSDRGSEFVQCQLSFTDPRFAKYPQLPVLACIGYAKGESPSSRP
jgi:hypothetical protein